MKRLTTKIFTIAACAAMMLTAAPIANMQSVQAATTSQGKVNLATKKLVIPNGVKTAMTGNTLTMVKGRSYQVNAKFGTTTVATAGTYKSSKPAIVAVSSTGIITAKAAGTSTIKVTYKGATQSFTVKVVASHTHSWKTTTAATCAAQGARLCQTCGVTGSIAKTTTHKYKVTKKATCETAGKQTCTVCGTTASIAKTAHNYITDTWTGIEGRGKTYSVITYYCNGCNIDMTNWTHDERELHWVDIDGVIAGTSPEDCFGAGEHGAAGVTRYPKYMMVDLKETYCKTCGTEKDKTKTDLYEVYYDEWRNVVRKSDNKIIEETSMYKKAKPYLAKGWQPVPNSVQANAKANKTALVSDTGTNAMTANDIVLADTENASDAEIIIENTEDADVIISDINDSIEDSSIVFDDDSEDNSDIVIENE